MTGSTGRSADRTPAISKNKSPMLAVSNTVLCEAASIGRCCAANHRATISTAVATILAVLERRRNHLSQAVKTLAAPRGSDFNAR